MSSIYHTQRFNTQPPEGGWVLGRFITYQANVSTHSRPKAAGPNVAVSGNRVRVSTHSRPKAAGPSIWSGSAAKSFQHTAARRRLGRANAGLAPPKHRFNTQPPEGGWDIEQFRKWLIMVSTHSRPKAAGMVDLLHIAVDFVSTHSRPKAAGAMVAVFLMF